MLVGMGLLATVGIDTSVLAVAGFAFVLGTGIGFAMQPSLLAAQNSAPQRDLGTATSTALLFRSLGNTIGIPIFGGILNAGLAGRARDAAAFADAIPMIFMAAVPVAVLSIVFSFRLPERPLREDAAVRALRRRALTGSPNRVLSARSALSSIRAPEAPPAF